MSTADPSASGGIEPKSSIGSVACREDGASVFDANAYDLAAKVGGEFEFVADGSDLHIGRTHITIAFVVCAKGFYKGVFRTIDHPAVFEVVPIVACNAMDGGDRTRVNAGVPGCRYGWGVGNISLLCAETFV